jgi:hypothetical protein
MRTLLYIFIFLISTSSCILSLLLMLEPGGRLSSWNLSSLTNTRFDNFRVPGFLLFLTLGLPSLFCLFMMALNQRFQYLFTQLLGLIQLSLSIYILQSINAAQWIAATLLIVSFFIIIISYQLRGKKMI